ncbi:MAG TPA: hypothetical protein VEO95_06835 [Chthoniobacteraceae bacterium]|nr:hypothetical protein [Chthoniobacteraceae bacterium]
MNSRQLIFLAVVVLVICGAAIWFLQSTPPAPPLPAIVSATPGPIDTKPAAPPPADSSALTKPEQRAATAAPSAPPKPAALADWEIKIDSVLRANPDNSDAANSATAQMLINLLPTLPPEGQTEAAQHISNLLADKDYNRVLPLIKNPTMPEDVLDVLVTDLMNREDPIKLPTLLEIAKIPNHPHHEEAATDLQIFLDEDYGTDWAKWQAKLNEYLKKQAAENAAAESAAPPVVGK